MRVKLVLCLILISACSYAQNCNIGFAKAKGGALGYKKRSGNHCEGLLTEWKVSGAKVNLISFTQGSPVFQYSESEELLIKSALKSQQTSVAVRGQSFGMIDMYRLDFSLLANGEKTIPTNEVIYPAVINYRNFGIFAYSGNGEKTVYSPVSLLSKKNNFKPVKQDRFFIKLTTNMRIDLVQWQIAPGDIDEHAKFGDIANVPEANINTSFAVIEIPKSSLTGKYCLQVWYKPQGGSLQSAKYNLLVP